VANDRIRVFDGLAYGDPRGFLVALLEIEERVVKSALDRKTRTLKTNLLKPLRERREAALCCHFMAERIGKEVLFAHAESQDHDIVARVEDYNGVCYILVQLKEVVPAHLNPHAAIEDVVAALARYQDSKDLTVAIHLNQGAQIDLSTLTLPALNIGALWVYYASSRDGGQWSLYGDVLRKPTLSHHHYPIE
jgi:hypothetical protein